MTAIIPARPTLYKGIRMRSRLEADYAAYLDSNDWPWEYEPECFASEHGQWLPDFRVNQWPTEREAPRLLVEVKPSIRAIPGTRDYQNRVDEHLQRMEIAWDTDPSLGVKLVIWRYGGPAESVVYSFGRSEPWLVNAPDYQTHIWMGMGQFERLQRKD